eukprot:15034937-Alexandrium_andersonii.AAC.1
MDGDGLAWRVLLTSRRLLAACWGTPVPRAGGRVRLVVRPPPSGEEQKRRGRARVPFRSWCPRCARGRMPNLPRS